MPYIEQDEFALLLLKAVNEAEGWYDESRGLKPGQRLVGLEECYAILDANGLKTNNEQATNSL